MEAINQDVKKEAAVFDIESIDAMDQSIMTVMVGDRKTNWEWFIAGPGHPMGIAQTNRLAREQIAKDVVIEKMQVNRKKYKPEEQSPEELAEDNVKFVLERLIGWSEVNMGGKPFPFTQENARALLLDRKKGALLAQAVNFILDENSFIKRSAKK